MSSPVISSLLSWYGCGIPGMQFLHQLMLGAACSSSNTQQQSIQRQLNLRRGLQGRERVFCIQYYASSGSSNARRVSRLSDMSTAEHYCAALSPDVNRDEGVGYHSDVP